MTVNYLNLVQASVVLGVTYSTLCKIKDAGAFLDPDVEIGIHTSRVNKGYTLDRVIAYGKGVGRLTKDGEICRVLVKTRDYQSQPFWHAVPERYLSQTEATRRMGLKNPLTLIGGRKTGGFLAPHITIGDESNRSIPGWDEDLLVEWAVKVGRLESDGITPTRRAA